MKILHISDLHLDTPFTGIGQNIPELQKYLIKAPYSAFEKSIDIALQEKVDLFIITGDIYNSERQTIHAQHFFMQQLERLDDGNIPVVLSHGNHDHLREAKARVNYPQNVKVFLDDQVDFFDFELSDGATVRVYGFSYMTKWIKQAKVADYPANPYETDYTIGMLHAAMEASDTDADNYAPFKVRDLLEKNYDYWALGHIHKAEVLNESPLIQYPGNIQGGHRNESGDKGCRIININKGQANINQFYSLAPIVWQDIRINCQADWQAKDLIAKISEIKHNFKEEGDLKGQSYILDIELDHAERLDSELLEQIQFGGLMEIIDNAIQSDEFVFINQIKPQLNIKLEVFDYDVGLKESYQHVIEDYQEGGSYLEVMADLMNHAIVKQYFPLEQDEELQAKIIESARQEIAQRVGLDTEVEVDDLEN